MRARGAWVAAGIVLAACGGHADAGGGGADAASATLTGVPVGSACTPSVEGLPTFPGFTPGEVVVEDHNPACGAGVCLANHFQGLTTCPYGQDAQGNAPAGQTPCAVPGTGQRVAPVPPAQVPPWCVDRPPSAAVYCSCRCANADGATDDGAAYCACGSGFTCTQLIAPIGAGDPLLTGAYCVANGTAFDPAASCASMCDPTTHACAK
jgi:hypothetical protein